MTDNGNNNIPPKNGLAAFFKVTSEEDNFIIEVTKKEAELIYYNSMFTANKMMGHEVLEEIKGEISDYGIKFKKLYGLSSKEWALGQHGVTTEIWTELQEIQKTISETMEIPLEEMAEFITDPESIDNLPLELKNELMNVLRNSQEEKERQTKLNLVTLIVKNRKCNTWTTRDTEALPLRILQEILYFVEQEQLGWGESLLPENSEESVIALDTPTKIEEAEAEEKKEVTSKTSEVTS